MDKQVSVSRFLQQAGRASGAKPPPPPPPEPKQAKFNYPVTLDRKRLLKLASCVAATLGGMAFALYLNYGSFTPCGALHAKARALFMTAVGTDHPFALMLAGVMPVEALVDEGLTQRFGSAGPLQCTYVLFSPDWDQAMRDAMHHERH